MNQAKLTVDRWHLRIPLLLIIGLALASCTVPTPVSPTPQPTAGLPNPASAYCGEQGGRLEIRTDEHGGQYGVCIFADGSECEEWAFFRGECAPESDTEVVATSEPGRPQDMEVLIATVQATLPEKAFEFGGLRALPLTVPEGQEPLWAVHSYGMRNYDLQPVPNHFVALYTWATEIWQELARIELAPEDPDALGPDYIGEEGVIQAFIDPAHIWLEVQGGAGAHSGTYQLLSYDGAGLAVAISSFSPSPGAGQVRDVNGDAIPEVVLDVTEPYIFCYACGVRYIAYQVFRWDPANQRLIEVTLQPMLMGQSDHPARKATVRAVELAQAGLWKDALAKIVEAKQAAVDSSEPTDNETLEWDYALIKLHADAMAADVAEAVYPLLSNVFYGDYAAAVDVMRPYDPRQLFTPETPLVVGTAAEGWLEPLVGYVTQSATDALAAEPELAAAYFLRGWAAYLADPANPQAAADVVQAAALAPGDALFSAAVSYLNSLAQPAPTSTRIQFAPGATSAVIEGRLAAGRIDEYVLRAMSGQFMMVRIGSPQNDVLLEIYGMGDGQPLVRVPMDETAWQGTLSGTQDYSLKAVSVGGATDYRLQVIIPARVQFAAGASSATIQGRVTARDTIDYILTARAGQTMTVTITSPANDVLVAAYGIDDGQPLVRREQGVVTWTGILPATQDYIVEAISVGRSTSYVLEIIIT